MLTILNPILSCRVMALFSALCLCACSSFHSNKTQAADERLSVTSNPGYKHLLAELNALVQERGTPVNHFYVAPYQPDKNLTYMVWKEARKLWILPLGNADEYSWSSVRFPKSGSFLDLDKDVVATPEEVGSSAYLVTREWVTNVIYDAAINGDVIRVDKASTLPESDQ